jgi:hypothetical protein
MNKPRGLLDQIDLSFNYDPNLYYSYHDPIDGFAETTAPFSSHTLDSQLLKCLTKANLSQNNQPESQSTPKLQAQKVGSTVFYEKKNTILKKMLNIIVILVGKKLQ